MPCTIATCEDSDDDTVVQPYLCDSINNEDDAATTEPHHLNSPIEHDFTCTGICLDNDSHSRSAVPYDGVGNDYLDDKPPSEPPPACMPEIKFTATSPVLQDPHNDPSACFMLGNNHGMTHANQFNFDNLNNSCDCALKANLMLSSVVTLDATKPLLFPSKHDLRECINPISDSHSNLLAALQSLPTADMLNTLNSDPTRKLTCRDTVMLMQSRKMDGELMSQ